MTAQAKEEMTELVREDPAEGGTQGVFADSRRVFPIPAPRDRTSHLLRPDRHPPRAEMGNAQAVIVNVTAASADDLVLGPRKYDDGRRRRGRGRAGNEPPLKPDSARVEQTIHFRESPLERGLRELGSGVDRKLDGENRAQKKGDHCGHCGNILTHTYP